MWLLESPLSEETELDQHIEWMVDLMEAKAAELQSVRATGFELDIFCMFSSQSGQGSAVLSAKLLGRLAVTGVELIIDLYPPCADEVE
jgi:hypothetical protein